jgi:hypothetical protein
VGSQRNRCSEAKLLLRDASGPVPAVLPISVIKPHRPLAEAAPHDIPGLRRDGEAEATT